MRFASALCLLLAPLTIAISATALAAGAHAPFELHQRLQESARAHHPTVALTLDACGG
jgi:hypothetical protein